MNRRNFVASLLQPIANCFAVCVVSVIAKAMMKLLRFFFNEIDCYILYNNHYKNINYNICFHNVYKFLKFQLVLWCHSSHILGYIYYINYFQNNLYRLTHCTRYITDNGCKYHCMNNNAGSFLTYFICLYVTQRSYKFVKFKIG